MKKVLFLALYSCFLSLGMTQAQAVAEPEEHHITDEQRVALTAVVLDDEIPAGARKQLENKMNQLAAKNGCAATANSRFIITCSADVLTKDITPTAPPMHAYTVMLNFYVGDGIEGRLFSSCSIESKGVGQTPDKAYINALKNVRINDPGLKSMIDIGKQEIVAYYNTNCDIIIAEAKAKAARNEFSAAIEQLTSIPPVCEVCYRRALAESEAVYVAWRDHICLMALNNAQNAWAKRDAKEAAEALCLVPVDGACYPEAEALRNQIGSRLDAKDKQDWDYKMKQYEDRRAVQAQSNTARSQTASAGPARSSAGASKASIKPAAMEQPAAAPQQQSEKSPIAKKIEAVKEAAAVVAPEPEPAKPTYQVKGKWFK